MRFCHVTFCDPFVHAVGQIYGHADVTRLRTAVTSSICGYLGFIVSLFGSVDEIRRTLPPRARKA